jgi:hypothetical protein
MYGSVRSVLLFQSFYPREHIFPLYAGQRVNILDLWIIIVCTWLFKKHMYAVKLIQNLLVSYYYLEFLYNEKIVCCLHI